MNRFVKTWIVWILMLALPLQALAGAAQLSCETGGHQRQAGGHVAKSGHGVYARQAVRLKRGAKPAAGAKAEKGMAACGACAGCCCASAVLPILHAVPAPRHDAGLLFASLPAPDAGYIPDGLERPPRHHS